MVSSAYLRLLIFLMAIMIPDLDSSRPAFHMMYSAYRGFPGGSDGKESACNARDPGSIPRSGRPPEEENGYPIQYSCLENSMTEEPNRLQSIGSQRVNTTEQLILSLSLCI